MRHRVMFRNAVFVFALSLLTACGGGGGAAVSSDGNNNVVQANTVTINITSTPPSSASYTGNGTDPVINALVSGGFTGFSVAIGKNTTSSGWDKSFSLSLPGTTPGIYTVDAKVISVSTAVIHYFETGEIFTGITGTVNLTAVGAVGEPITGTYDVMLCSTGTGTCNDTTRKITMNGGFNVTRIY